jgi:hypothetical protein
MLIFTRIVQILRKQQKPDISFSQKVKNIFFSPISYRIQKGLLGSNGLNVQWDRTGVESRHR